MTLRPRAAFGRPVVVLAALAAGAAISTGTAAQGAASGGKTVTLKDIAFNREVTTIKTGQRITWSWQDPYSSHNIHSVGRPRFKGASERRTGTYSVRFTRRGTYRYACTLHPGMNGKIVVK